MLAHVAPSALLVSLLSLPHIATAFYLPGVAPTTYKKGDSVPLYVNSISPTSQDDLPIKAVESYDYYYPPFRFCKPEGGPKPIGESLGSILFGDRIMTSPFELNMAVNETCKQLCKPVQYSPLSLGWVGNKVQHGYSMNWIVDGLPAGQEMMDVDTLERSYTPGFKLGGMDGENPYFHNHYNIFIDYHEVAGNPDQLRVVGVSVVPESIDYGDGKPDCKPRSNNDKLTLVSHPPAARSVHFTYRVGWQKSETAWATRWDKYLKVRDSNVHWFFLIDGAIIVIILVLTVISILVRTLKKDIARYNRLDQINLDDLSGTSVEDGIQEDSGWKLVHGDVFRPPPHTLLLSLLLGNGAQIFVMTGMTIVFALLGFLSPSNRGALGSIMIILYTFLSTIGGYVSARVYKAWQGEKWKVNLILTPIAVPGLIFGAFFFLNLFLWARQSSGAVPFTTMLVIISIWFVISIPLSVLGSWLGFRSGPIEAPVRTNQIPRQVPVAPTYLRRIPSILIVGMVPFGAIFFELLSIVKSIWFGRIYYMFGFLFLCYCLMIMSCAAVTIMMTYFLLCAENYNWQWRSFLGAGMSGGYVFLYCIGYLALTAHLTGFAGIVLFLGYSLLISFTFFVLTGKSHIESRRLMH